MPRIEAWTICFFWLGYSFVWYRMALRLRHLFLGIVIFIISIISRKAVFVSCLYDLSDYELELVFSDTIGYTPRQLLSSLAFGGGRDAAGLFVRMSWMSLWIRESECGFMTG